ncbi:hypothetical protein BDR07DRAFT_1420640, partial [Suillus spraguei]
MSRHQGKLRISLRGAYNRVKLMKAFTIVTITCERLNVYPWSTYIITPFQCGRSVLDFANTRYTEMIWINLRESECPWWPGCSNRRRNGLSESYQRSQAGADLVNMFANPLLDLLYPSNANGFV